MLRNCLISFILLFSIVTVGYGSQYVRLDPAGGKKVIIAGKTSNLIYYRLAPGQNMNFEFSRRGECKIYSRAEFTSELQRETLYSFRMGLNSQAAKLFGRGTTRATSSIKGEKVGVGLSRTFTKDVDDTTRVLKLAVDKDAPCAVYFRVMFKPELAIPQGRFLAFSPSGYSDIVEVITNEIVSEYYLLDKSKSLEYAIIGPTVIKLNFRIALSETLFPRRTISILQDNKVIHKQSLRFQSSSVSKVDGKPAVTLSRAEQIHIEVPPGRHRYTFKDSQESGMLMVRVLLPEEGLDPNG